MNSIDKVERFTLTHPQASPCHVAESRTSKEGMHVMEDRVARELRAAIDRHSETPELRELWLRVLGLQLLVEDLTERAHAQIGDSTPKDS
jgi:hypothetical protein